MQDLSAETVIESKNQTIAEFQDSILIVDDDPIVLLSLQAILEHEHYHVIAASSGYEAIEVMQKQPVAVIICDQNMPGINGTAVLQRALVLHPDSIRIILTGNSDLNTAVQVINLGQISQFIVKPWDNASILQTVHSSIEKYRLTRENRQLHELIKNQHKALSKSHESLQQEIQLGAHIQEVLLLGKKPNDVSGFSIDATSIPSRDVDGDFFDFYRPNATTLDVVIGDVMGKGIPAALVGTAVKMQFVRFALPFTPTHLFDKLRLWHEDILPPYQILQHVHDEIDQQLIELEFFVSLFYGRFDLAKQTFTYVDCGSTKPLHYRKAQKTIVPLAGNNLPLGLVEVAEYRDIALSYGIGDLFVFYSDGVTEARAPDGELYGCDRLKQLVQDNADMGASDLLALVQQTVLAFAQKKNVDDDLTMIIIKIEECSISKALQPQDVKFKSDLAQLKAVRAYVKTVCQNAPGDEERLIELLELAINEAFCNIVKHGYENSPDGDVLIRGELLCKGVLFEIRDQGKNFNPKETAHPSLVGDQDNGFGWYIIREIVDELAYTPKQSDTGWNHLRIFKRYFTKEGLMEVTHSTKENILVITPEGGHLDAKEAPAFKQQVVDLISHNEAKHVIFDLHNLQFIDSSGLGTFLSILRILNTHSGDLKLSCMGKSVRTIFELVCMHKIFEIYNTTDDAIRSFK